MKAQGQITFEFMIVLVILFSAFLFALFVYGERNTGFIYAKENHEARLLADKLGRTINTVYLTGNGAEAKVFLEKMVDFNASVSGNALAIEWRTDNYIDSALLTDDITVISLTLGGWVNVRNVEGGIEIENA